MNAAQHVIKTFGGASKLAKLLKVELSTVSQWKIRNGLIPTKQQHKILKLAKKMGLKVTPHHIIYGTDA